MMLFRVVKQALRSSGANVTDKHISDISMCALFLLEAAKRCDRVFAVPPKCTAHTVADSKSDIRKIVQHLLERGITVEDVQRTTPAFEDPTDSGLNKLTKSDWLHKHLQSSSCGDALQGEGEYREMETDIDYELFDAT